MPYLYTYLKLINFVLFLGGGPANARKEDPLHLKIISLNTTSAVGLYNAFDSDSIAPESSDHNNFAEAQVILPEEPVFCVVKVSYLTV